MPVSSHVNHVRELGPQKDREKLNPRSSRGLDHRCCCYELHDQTGAGRGNVVCQFQGNEHLQVRGRVR